MDKLLTIEEVSQMTRLPVNTLRSMKQENRGPKCGKLGRRIFYKELEVIAWVDAQFDQRATSASLRG